MKMHLCLSCSALLMATLPVRAIEPTAQEMQQIKAKLAALDTSLEAIRAAKVDDDLLIDAEVAKHAVELALRFPEEFTDQAKVRQALSALDHGLQRASQLKDGKPLWPSLKGRVSRAYRSRVDGTAQPYRVIIPASYDKSRPMPLYVYLHGRSDTDFETNWVGGPDKAGGTQKGGGKSYGASSHVPVMIFPNPFKPNRYVVLNAGLTAQGLGASTSSYGDYAVLNIGRAAETNVGVVALFDENWKLPSRK